MSDNMDHASDADRDELFRREDQTTTPHDELKRLAEAATHGSWSAFYKRKYDEWHVAMDCDSPGMNVGLFEDGCPTGERDAKFIAAANPTVVLTLLAEIEALRGQVADEKAGAEILDKAGAENGDKYAVTAALLKELADTVIRLKMGTPEGLNVKDFARHCEAELERIKTGPAIRAANIKQEQS